MAVHLITREIGMVELGLLKGEGCGIKVEGKNKWLTLIQNAKINERKKFKLAVQVES
jgi:hypothetical protein